MYAYIHSTGFAICDVIVQRFRKKHNVPIVFEQYIKGVTELSFYHNCKSDRKWKQIIYWHSLVWYGYRLWHFGIILARFSISYYVFTDYLNLFTVKLENFTCD